VEKPSIIINTNDGKYKIRFEESIVIGADNYDFEVSIPIICDKCETRILHNDELESFDSHKKEMGSEILWHNYNTEIYCPKCDSLITVEVEISSYAYGFEFYDYNIKNCAFSHVFDLEKLDDYVLSKKRK